MTYYGRPTFGQRASAGSKVVIRVGQRSFPLLAILFLIMFTLKVAHVGDVADWSWWWVTAPLWGPFALVVGGTTVVLFGLGVIYLLLKGIGWVSDLLSGKRAARKAMRGW